MSRVPCIPALLLLEIPLILCVAIAIVLTSILFVLGIFSVIFAFWTKEKAFKAWMTIPELWKPWWMHFRVYKWSWLVLTGKANNDMDELAAAEYSPKAHKGKTRREKRYYCPSVDLGEIFAGMLLALDLAYIGTLLVLFILSITIFGGVVHVVKLDFNVKPEPIAPLKKPAYRPSEIQLQEQDFRPFYDQNKVGDLRSKAGVNNFALISDTGEVRYSEQWTIDPRDGAWRPSTTMYITSYEVKGTAVTFTDDRQPPTTLSLNTNQPFSFENKATLVFMFRSDGSLVQANRDKVKKVKTDTVSSNAKPNPDLSIL